MSIECIGVIGLGEVGRVLVEDLLQMPGICLRVWDYQFGNAGSVAARNLAELEPNQRVCAAEGASSAAQGCQLLLSAVTADQAFSAAGSILPGLEQGALFVDLNSVSPGTKKVTSDLVEAAGGRFVEASVMSPIMPLRLAAPVLLSGSHARELESIGPQLGFSNLRTVSDELGVASATKMCRSVIVKGMEALVTESLLAARHYGVEDTVLASLDNLFPGSDWPHQARYLICRSLEHGERRASEMREVARTIEEAGYSPWMSEGCVKRQAWAPQFSSALDEDSLDDMLDAIRKQSIMQEIERTQ